MDQIQISSPSLEEQQIEQILVYARTFRKHPLIMLGKKQVSPYDLAFNGFVNKNFKEEEKQQDFNDSQIRQVICICRIPECSKTIKVNDMTEKEDNEEQIQTILTEHQENCLFYRKQFSKFSLNKLFQTANALFEKIHQSYKKDDKRQIQGLKISWSFVEKLFLTSSENNEKFSILLECYKNLDQKFCMNTKRFDKTKLLSLFGWKLNSIKQNELISLKCHFCGKKVQKELDSKQFDPQNQHNLWCLVKNKQYQIWKLILKKTFTIQKNKQIQKQVNTQTKEFIVPKKKQQIESKEIRQQLYEFVKPALEKIDQLLLNSIETVKKLRHLNETQNQRSQFPENEINKNQQQFKTFLALDQISINAKQIIKNFINSIQTKTI